jgi:DNA ligase D-like protein (predicted 3'-phosphoesterase)
MNPKTPSRLTRKSGASAPPRSPPGASARLRKRPGSWSRSTRPASLHYDFRLEVEGVLKSWAVPKGPSLNPKDKRLAVPTEDHPLEYADFEGVIPEGEYGAGTVMVWDIGIFRNITEKKGQPVPLAEAVPHGHVKVWLEGKKLRGGFALTRFKKSPEEAWLLVKADDEGRRPKPGHPGRGGRFGPDGAQPGGDCRSKVRSGQSRLTGGGRGRGRLLSPPTPLHLVRQPVQATYATPGEIASIRAAIILAEIITEKLTAVFVLVAIQAEIFPVGAIRGIIPGIAILVMHR